MPPKRVPDQSRVTKKQKLIEASRAHIEDSIKSRSNALHFSSSFYHIDTNQNCHYCDYSVLEYLASHVRGPNEIEDVQLAGCNIGAKGMRALSKANLPNLRTLNLYKNQLGEEDMKYVCKGSWGQLKEIVLDENCIKNQGVKIVAGGRWHSLESLHLNNCAICGMGTKQLIGNCWTGLKSLYLRDNKIDNRGIEQLVKCAFNQLTVLNLGSNYLTNCCIKALVKGEWPVLQHLVLSGNLIEDEGLRMLATGHFGKLRVLELSSGSMITSRPFTQISMGGIKNLVKGEWKGVSLVICKPQTKNICSLLIFSQKMSIMLQRYSVEKYEYR